MAKITVTLRYKGKASEPVGWEALLRIFDGFWGEEARTLPKYPKVLGGVHAIWVDGDAIQHDAESLDEVKESYVQKLTASISFVGSLTPGPYCDFRYFPIRDEASIEVKASDTVTAEKLVEIVKNEFPLEIKFVFISYHNSEFQLATFIADVIQKRLARGISVFVAKRDILPGSSPLKVMLEEQLLGAEVLVALCSQQSKTSPWLWWESSAVWARGKLVVPIFIDISADEFNGPITLVCQGRSFFKADDINSVLSTIVTKLSPGQQVDKLTDEEVEKLRGFESSLIS
jgi:hypothetical protein